MIAALKNHHVRGRKAIDMRKSDNALYFRIQPERKHKLRRYARSQGLTMTGLLAKFIDELPDENKNAAQPGSNSSVFAN
jgi:hypothetical protein